MHRYCFIEVLLGAAASAVLAFFWLRRSMSRPIAEIAAAAERLARGEHDARVRLPPTTRLGRLGATLNLLAERFQHDISELHRLEHVRKEFVANVSHELRTPLATIKAYAETLREGALEDAENRLEFISEIEKNAERMTRLVDDLLTISALESGKMPPVFEPVDLMDIAREVVVGMMALAQKKQAIIRLETFQGIARVRADKNQLKQVLTNLIENAVKYTGEKGIISVSASMQEGRPAVSVRDNGCGIPAESIPRIFERFYRVDKNRSRESGGTGLGLAIVKHIVEVHGGSVSVESTLGEGSVFRFTLPAA
ncbi:MAG: ATP-binding protein [Elusimicrobiota bacterium]|jgi:two-component system phosphate regulon sensor histidine kinase PhoR